MRHIINVAGVIFRPRDVKDLIRSDVDIGTMLTLEREPDNKHDPNAIKLLFNDVHIGYVPRDVAEDVAELLDEGAEATCEVIGFSNDVTPTCEFIVQEA